MKRIIVILITLLLILTGCTQGEEDMKYQQITMDEAAVLMEKETGYIILDVRTEAEYVEGHIPGAICIPNENIGERVDVEEQLPHLEQMILVYCRSGNRSKQAAEKLADMGYTNIIECGGIMDWDGEIKTGEI